jgi:hypothetical protein
MPHWRRVRSEYCTAGDSTLENSSGASCANIFFVPFERSKAYGCSHEPESVAPCAQELRGRQPAGCRMAHAHVVGCPVARSVRATGGGRKVRAGYRIGPLFTDNDQIVEELLGALAGHVPGQSRSMSRSPIRPRLLCLSGTV